MKYIIQPSIQIGNPKNRIIKVLTSDEVKDYRKDGFKCKEKAYLLIVGRIEYEIVCMEIWQKGDKEHSLLIPAFLVPHRAYPAYIYTFAINLYSSNPQLSQRKVAEETRKKYNLETFAHTTVGRAMKTLAETLAELAVKNSKTPENVQVMKQNETIQDRRFPSVQDTSKRRKIVKSFFYKRLRNRCEQGFKKACDRIAIYWYEHFHRLLMNTAPGIGRKLSIVTQSI